MTRWSPGLLVMLLSCSPAPSAPAPSAPPTASIAATAPPPVASSAPSAVGGWAPHPDPRKAAAALKPVTDYASCVEQLRSAQWMGDAPGIDLYTLAWEDERAGKLDSARKGYFQLISTLPSSPLVPLTYLAFGELFAAESPQDPSKWELAKQAFEQTLKYPLPNNAILAYATLRLAEAHQQTSERPRALSLYKQAAERAAHPSQQCGPYLVERSQQQSR